MCLMEHSGQNHIITKLLVEQSAKLDILYITRKIVGKGLDNNDWLYRRTS